MSSTRSNKPRISVIIITLNEEKRLPILLRCLQQQSYRDFEVIVADANSTDRTREIAENNGARVVPGGPVAVGRNSGAAAAKGTILVFLDADVRVPRNFLATIDTEFRARSLAIACTWSKPDTKAYASRFLYGFYNTVTWLGQSIAPRTPGHCILVTAALHKKLRGFDRRVQFEDIDYALRARGKGNYAILPLLVTVSDRRFTPGNRLSTVYVLVRSELDRWFGIRRFHWYTYPFGQHPEQKQKKRLKA